MEFRFDVDCGEAFTEPKVGNVYQVRGGTGAKHGWVHVLISITKDGMCPMLTVDRDGDIVGATSYALHYLKEKAPIAHCPEMESEMVFTVRSL